MGIKESFLKSCGEVKSSAKKLGAEIKLQRQISNLKAELDELYKTLGKIRFEQITDDDATDIETKRIIAEIKRLNEKLNFLSKDNERICEICGKALEKNNEFCPYCGTKQ